MHWTKSRHIQSLFLLISMKNIFGSWLFYVIFLFVFFVLRINSTIAKKLSASLKNYPSSFSWHRIWKGWNSANSSVTFFRYTWLDLWLVWIETMPFVIKRSVWCVKQIRRHKIEKRKNEWQAMMIIAVMISYPSVWLRFFYCSCCLACFFDLGTVLNDFEFYLK